MSEFLILTAFVLSVGFLITHTVSLIQLSSNPAANTVFTRFSDRITRDLRKSTGAAITFHWLPVLLVFLFISVNVAIIYLIAQVLGWHYSRKRHGSTVVETA